VDYETLLVERDGPVGWLVFNRPAAANAMDAAMMHELEGAWLELDRDPDVRVIVNTGAGDAFAAGLLDAWCSGAGPEAALAAGAALGAEAVAQIGARPR